MRLLAKFIVLVAAAAIVMAATVVTTAPLLRDVVHATRSEAKPISLGPLCERSLVKAADGSLIASLKSEQNRSFVPLEKVPQHVVDAILAVEDREFWHHGGVNVRATMRALVRNVDEGGVSQGGSTITQQLVKKSIVGSKRDLDRKAREAILAVRLEDQYSKKQILERYLNTVYFGSGAYGLQAAAETYFGIGVRKLDIAQAALLAAVIRNPSGYDPFLHPKIAKRRRDLALRQLAKTKIITDNERLWYSAYRLPDHPHRVLPPPDDYFVEEVKGQLQDDPRIGETRDDRLYQIFCGGLTIETTFDPRAQALALAARNNVIGRFGDPNVPGTFPLPNNQFTGAPQYGTVAITSVEPTTGAVRAMVGGPGFKRYKYNLVTQAARQGGSSFKTFVLTTLMQEGYIPDDSVSGSGPCTFHIPGIAEPYQVENFGGSGGGGGTILSQTLRSSNCAYVRLGQIAGLGNVVRTAKRMGITTPLDPSIYSLPLGSMEVRPIDMAAAYSVVFDDGLRHPAYMIERVLDRSGKVVFEHHDAPEQVLSVQAAREVQEVLKENVEGGTGTRARISGWDVGGKTGTAQDFGDAWFVGSTKKLTTAVWMGSPQGRVPMRSVGGRSVVGGSWPAEIWVAYMAPWHAGLTPVAFTAPAEPTRSGHYLRADGQIDSGGYISRSTYRRPYRRSSATSTTTSTPHGKGHNSTTTMVPTTESPTTTESPPTTDKGGGPP